MENIMDRIEELVEKISGDDKMVEKFKSNPVDTVKSLLGGIDLDNEIVEKIVAGIKAKLGAGKLGGLLDKVTDLLDGDN